MREKKMNCQPLFVQEKFSAGQTCMWWDYDPKMPKSVKKLRKF